MKYTKDYRETVALADGVELVLRAIQPADKAALLRAFGRLSVETRRRRFFSTKNELSEQELRYLTECDGLNHYAIVASRDVAGGEPEGVGVARFVRVPDEPRVAELAIVVVDDWQRRGIGTLLLERIVAAAAERDIGRIRALALPDNQQIRALIEHHADEVEILNDDGLLQMTIRVPETDHSDALEAMLSMLSLAAPGTIMIPIWLGRRSLHQLLSLGRKPDAVDAEKE